MRPSRTQYLPVLALAVAAAALPNCQISSQRNSKKLELEKIIARDDLRGRRMECFFYVLYSIQCQNNGTSPVVLPGPEFASDFKALGLNTFYPIDQLESVVVEKDAVTFNHIESVEASASPLAKALFSKTIKTTVKQEAGHISLSLTEGTILVTPTSLGNAVLQMQQKAKIPPTNVYSVAYGFDDRGFYVQLFGRHFESKAALSITYRLDSDRVSTSF